MSEFFKNDWDYSQPLAEQKKCLSLKIAAFVTVIDEFSGFFKKQGKTPILTAYKKKFTELAKELVAPSPLPDTPIEPALQAANLLYREFEQLPTVIEAASEKAKRAETLERVREESNFFIDTVSQFVYLNVTDGKVMVLIDNIAKAEVEETKHQGLAYTQLRYADAALVFSNIPYTKTDATGAERPANVLDGWKNSEKRTDLRGITFDPSSPERIVNDQYNIWRGWLYTPEPTPSYLDDPFWELTLDVICDGNEEYFEFVRKYLAHLVQKPQVRPLCALGISGPQGYGKSVFVKAIGSLMHESHYNPNVPMKSVAGDQQGRDLEGVLLAYLDEASWGGDRLSTGAMKKAITGETDRINEKFVPAYNVPTYKRIIFSSNDKYYYHADADDRRLLPLEIDPNKPVKPDSFFQQIFNGQEPRPEVERALFTTLMNIDISTFVPHIALKALKIETGTAMLEKSMSNVQRWLKDAINERAFELEPIERGDPPIRFDEGWINPTTLQAAYSFYCGHASFDKNRQENIRAHENIQILRTVFGHTNHMTKKHGRAYKIDWNEMRVNFQSMFKWKVEFEEYPSTPQLNGFGFEEENT